MSRPDVMRQVEKLEGKDPAAFKPTSNNSYWAPAEVMRSEWERNEAGEMIQDPDGRFRQTPARMMPNPASGAYRYGVLVRGLVKVAGKKGNQLLYTLTDAGQKFAEEADAWIQSRPDLFGDIIGSV
jgi:hypothetical protein